MPHKLVAIVLACGVAMFGAMTIEAPAYAHESHLYCVGDSVTVTWPAAANTSGLRGYFIEHRLSNPANNGFDVERVSVGLDQTHLVSTLQFGINDYVVWTVDTSGQLVDVVGTAEYSAAQAPLAAQWDTFSDPSVNRVGNHTATVRFGWTASSITMATTGNASDTLVIRGGEQQATFTLDGVNTRFGTATFTGLTDGRPYTFTSDTLNPCGDAGRGGPSGTFVPGVVPRWIANTPPKVARFGFYVAWFHATGKPAPTYGIDGPAWLHIARQYGIVYGFAPRGTTTFSYSVTAHNGVGVFPGPPSDITAGPFTVAVRR